jgi:hypothetical protein
MRSLLLALAVAVAVGCIAAANVVLLGYGNKRHDQVGRLNPVASFSGGAPARPVVQVPEPEHGDGRDD